MIVCETQSIIIYHTITLHVQPAALEPYGGNMRHKNKEKERKFKKNVNIKAAPINVIADKVMQLF